MARQDPQAEVARGIATLVRLIIQRLDDSHDLGEWWESWALQVASAMLVSEVSADASLGIELCRGLETPHFAIEKWLFSLQHEPDNRSSSMHAVDASLEAYMPSFAAAAALLPFARKLATQHLSADGNRTSNDETDAELLKLFPSGKLMQVIGDIDSDKLSRFSFPALEFECGAALRVEVHFAHRDLLRQVPLKLNSQHLDINVSPAVGDLSSLRCPCHQTTVRQLPLRAHSAGSVLRECGFALPSGTPQEPLAEDNDASPVALESPSLLRQMMVDSVSRVPVEQQQSGCMQVSSARPGTPEPTFFNPFRRKSILSFGERCNGGTNTAERATANCEDADDADVYRQLRSSLCISPPERMGPFVGSFLESLLAGHTSSTPCSQFEGYLLDLRVRELSARSSAFSRQESLPFVAIYYHVAEDTPYVGTVRLPRGGIQVPRQGILQLTLQNPSHTPLKVLLVRYDLGDMPVHTKTFVRQRVVAQIRTRSVQQQQQQHQQQQQLKQHENVESGERLRYACHFKFVSPKRDTFYLFKNIRVLFPFRADDELAAVRVELDLPENPRFFPYSTAHAQQQPDLSGQHLTQKESA